MRGAFVFDPNRCTGCQACELACSIENRLGSDRSWRGVLTFNQQALPGVPLFHLSLACNHCEHPACMYACPALAYERDAATGAVLIRAESCIGCRYCSWACPYGAPSFEPDRGVMGKCTFCSHRLADGLPPACADLCPTGALGYAVLPPDMLTAEVEGFPRTELGPSIRILPPTGRSQATEHQPPSRAAGPSANPEPAIHLASEWSLAGFTYALAVLFALLAAGVAETARIPALGFAAVAGGAAALSLAHLGRPDRAWRAILNLRRSPVSREVFGFSGLAALGTLALALPPGESAAILGALGLGAGVLALASADAVYRPVYPGGHPALHSGGTLLTGGWLASLLVGIPWLAAPLGVLKLSLYVSRHRTERSRATEGGSRWAVALVRAGCGLLVPGAVWVVTGAPLPAWAIAAALLGDAVDRAEFYAGLEITSPARRMREDLEVRLLPPARSA